MNNEKNSGGAIKYIAVILAILIVVFLSQQPFARPVAQKVFNFTGSKMEPFASNGKEWFAATIYPRVTQEAKKRGEPLKQEVVTQKDNAVKIIWENVKNYFAGKFSKVFGTKVE